MVRGEQALRNALESAANEADKYTLGRVICCLADLLYHEKRFGEVRPMLDRFYALENIDDVLDAERRRADELASGLRAQTDRR